MNKILEKIIEARNGHYCHCVEVSDVYELENVAESIIEEFSEEHSESEIIEFLESLDVYALDDSKENEIFAFSFSDYIVGTL